MGTSEALESEPGALIRANTNIQPKHGVFSRSNTRSCGRRSGAGAGPDNSRRRSAYERRHRGSRVVGVSLHGLGESLARLSGGVNEPLLSARASRSHRSRCWRGRRVCTSSHGCATSSWLPRARYRRAGVALTPPRPRTADLNPGSCLRRPPLTTVCSVRECARGRGDHRGPDRLALRLCAGLVGALSQLGLCRPEDGAVVEVSAARARGPLRPRRARVTQGVCPPAESILLLRTLIDMASIGAREDATLSDAAG